MKRRDTFKLLPLSFAGIAGLAGKTFSGEKHFPSQPPHPEPLAFRYNNKIKDMLAWVSETQSENILEASYAVARTVKNGGRCWRAWDMGHSTTFDSFPGRNAEPELFTQGYDPKTAKKGDLFLASRWGGDHQDLVKKEILVIGSPVPWGGDAKGQELLREDVQKRKLRPYSQIWIETQLTTLGAVMYLPGMEAPFGPASGIIGLVIYWMIVADACRILARDGIKVSVKGDEPKLSGDNIPWVNLNEPLMDNYFDVVMKQIEMIRAEYGNIKRVAEMAVDTILSGGKVWTYSSYGPAIPAEGQGRRGGMMLTRGLRIVDGVLTAYDRNDTFGSSKDLVIMGAWEPDNEVDLKNLYTIRKKGMKVASIGTMTRNSRVPEGSTIPKEADVHVGRMCDTYGLYAVPGFERKVCPTSGALIMQMFWCTCMEIADEIMRRTGNVPAILLSGAIKTGNQHNSMMRARYIERGY